MPSSKQSKPSTDSSKPTKPNPAPPKTTYPLALVRWADAHAGVGGWLDMDDYSDGGEYVITSVGFLVPEDKKGGKKGHVTLWQTVCDGDGIHPFHIPAGMVRETFFLNP